jgi:hypothetical protein
VKCYTSGSISLSVHAAAGVNGDIDAIEEVFAEAAFLNFMFQYFVRGGNVRMSQLRFLSSPPG